MGASSEVAFTARVQSSQRGRGGGRGPVIHEGDLRQALLADGLLIERSMMVDCRCLRNPPRDTGREHIGWLTDNLRATLRHHRFDAFLHATRGRFEERT